MSMLWTKWVFLGVMCYIENTRADLCCSGYLQAIFKDLNLRDGQCGISVALVLQDPNANSRKGILNGWDCCISID